MREVRACIRKEYNLAHWQEQEARPAPDEPPFPRLWILSAGRPESVLSGYEMRSMDRDVWLPGFWQAAKYAYRIALPAGVDSYGIDEDVMEYTDKLERIYADWERQVNERAVQRTVIGVYERRFGAMPDELRETLGRVHGCSAREK